MPNLSPQSACQSTVTTTDENPPPPRPSPHCGGGEGGGIFVAEGAETAKGNQTSPSPRHRTVQNLPDPLSNFGSSGPKISGGSLRALRALRPLRFKCNVWVYLLSHTSALPDVAPGENKKNPGDPPPGPTGLTKTFHRKARRDRKDALDLKNPREPGCPEFSEPRPTHPLLRTWKYQGILCVLCVLCGSFALSGFDPWPGSPAIDGRACATLARPVMPAGSFPLPSWASSGRLRSRSRASVGTRSCA